MFLRKRKREEEKLEKEAEMSNLFPKKNVGSSEDLLESKCEHGGRLLARINRYNKKNPNWDKKYPRPLKRSDCENESRPCPYVACRWNLFLEVKETGSILGSEKQMFGEGVGGECALDYIDKYGQMTLEQVGEAFGITRERARQIIDEALKKVLSGVGELEAKEAISFLREIDGKYDE